MASSAACECGTEKQTADHVVLHCRIHRASYGMYRLAVLDDDTIKWPFNTCSDLCAYQRTARTFHTIKKKGDQEKTLFFCQFHVIQLKT